MRHLACVALLVTALLLLAACSTELGQVRCETELNCPEGQVCGTDGFCTAAPACASGETLCSGKCKALASDLVNCGSCGHTCAAPGNGSATCQSGTCGQVCTAPFVKTGADCRVAAPADLVATPGDGQVSLAWTAVTGATGYEVLRSLVSAGPYTLITSVTTPAYVDTNLSASTTFAYVLRATGPGGPGALSAEVLALTAPAAPTGLTAVASATSIALSWTAVTGATGYRVHRGTVTGGPTSLIASPTATSFSDPVGAAKTYFYSVRAANASGAGQASAEVTATTPDAPGQPTVSAPTIVTAGETSLAASVPARPGMTYAWTIAGGTITGPATGTTSGGLNTLSFTAGPAGALTLTCVETNGQGASGTPGTATVQVAPVPGTPTITAPATAVAGTPGLAASISPVTNMTYTWTISGGTIASGATSASITFGAGPAGTLTLGCTELNAAGKGGTPAARDVAITPASSGWATKPSLPLQRGGPAVAAIGGVLYVAGGNAATDTPTHQAFNTATGAWASPAPAAMPAGRYQGDGGAALGGLFYVPGGWTTSPGLPHSEVFAYDPAANSWSSKAGLPTLSGCGASGVIGGKLYVTTPCNGTSGYFKLLHVYDPSNNQWTGLASSPNAHGSPAGFGVIGTSLYVVGGYDAAGSTMLGILDVYDSVANTWSTKASLPAPRASGMGGVLGGKLYIAGGTLGSGAVSSVVVYDPGANSWTTGTALPTAELGGGTAVIDGQLWVVSGSSTNVYTFTP